MPIYLKAVDVVPEVVKFKSALIVVCRLGDNWFLLYDITTCRNHDND
jgi:hypothetical protein